MTPEKILIASPVRGGVSPAYIRNLTAILSANWEKRFVFQWAATTGTSVAWARDELADTAVTNGFDRVLWWDVDILFPDPKVMVAAVARLLTHNVDVVGAAYVGHNPLSQFHGANNNQLPREDGLMEMGQIPLGFSIIKTHVFKKLRKTHPWHQYVQSETGTRPPKLDMFEYFPTGVVGPNSAPGKIERLRKVFSIPELNTHEMLEEIKGVLGDDDYSSNYVLGEDFYFCRNAREAGFTLYIDNNMVAPHESKVLLPMQTETLLEGLTEDWRVKEGVPIQEVKQLVEALGEKMAKD